jgi:hypothetical protein
MVVTSAERQDAPAAPHRTVRAHLLGPVSAIAAVGGFTSGNTANDPAREERLLRP